MIAKFLALYLALSMAASAAYNACPQYAWDIAEHRNGLLIVSVDEYGVWLLDPLSNAGDGWWLEIGGGADE